MSFKLIHGANCKREESQMIKSTLLFLLLLFSRFYLIVIPPNSNMLFDIDWRQRVTCRVTLLGKQNSLAPMQRKKNDNLKFYLALDRVLHLETATYWLCQLESSKYTFCSFLLFSILELRGILKLDITW